MICYGIGMDITLKEYAESLKGDDYIHDIVTESLILEVDNLGYLLKSYAF